MSRSFQIQATAQLILNLIFRRCKNTKFLSTCHTLFSIVIDVILTAQ